MKKYVYVLSIAAALLSGTANAFIDPPVLEPNPAQQGEEVSLLIRMGECDGIFMDHDGNPLVYVDIVGQDITVIFDGNRNGIPVGCEFPIIDHEFSLGALNPGEYTVTVQISYETAPMLIITETIDVLSLVVEAPTPHAVPMGGLPAWFVLGLVLFVVGWIIIRRQQVFMILPLMLLAAHIPDTTAQGSQELVWIQANRFEAGPYVGPGMSASLPMSPAQACAEIDAQLAEYEDKLVARSSVLDENDTVAWAVYLEEVAAVDEVRDKLELHCES